MTVYQPMRISTFRIWKKISAWVLLTIVPFRDAVAGVTREPVIVPVREPVIVPVREPVIVPVREPVIVPTWAVVAPVLDPVMVPAWEIVTRERVSSKVSRIWRNCVI